MTFEQIRGVCVWASSNNWFELYVGFQRRVNRISLIYETQMAHLRKDRRHHAEAEIQIGLVVK